LKMALSTMDSSKQANMMAMES